MSQSPAHIVGRTLSRLATLRPALQDGPASDSRSQVLEALARADAPMTVDELASQLDLHPNTVRGRLEVLEASGQIVREAETSKRRGRPRMLYRLAEQSPDEYQQLAAALSRELESTHESLAAESATRWARTAGPKERAATPDEAVGNAVEILNTLGFTADVSVVGDAIALRNCPYASLVADQPVICDIHAALLKQLFAESGQPIDVESVDVWARPGLCVARLSRPDLVPARRIPMQESADE